PILADGKPLQDHERRQIRLRFRGGMDAQGPVDLPRRSPPQWREPAGHRAGRPVLFRSREDGRQALGYVQPAGAVGAVTLGISSDVIACVKRKAFAQGSTCSEAIQSLPSSWPGLTRPS